LEEEKLGPPFGRKRGLRTKRRGGPLRGEDIVTVNKPVRLYGRPLGSPDAGGGGGGRKSSTEKKKEKSATALPNLTREIKKKKKKKKRTRTCLSHKEDTTKTLHRRGGKGKGWRSLLDHRGGKGKREERTERGQKVGEKKKAENKLTP